MSSTKIEQTPFEISAGGSLNLSPEQLQQAGLAPGDRLVISAPAPGHLYLHKIDPLYPASLSHEALSQLMREAFEEMNNVEAISNIPKEDIGIYLTALRGRADYYYFISANHQFLREAAAKQKKFECLDAANFVTKILS